MFAIIKVDLDYDALLGMEFHSLYETYEEAQQFISHTQQQENRQWQDRLAYITRYVESIEVPVNPDYNTWQTFVAAFEPFSRLNPQSFKTELISRLSSICFVNQFSNRPDYQPPTFNNISHRLYIIEIPGVKYIWKS